MSKNELPQNPNTETVELDTPIIRGEQTINTVTITKPDAGRLRNVKLFDLLQSDVDTVIKVAPRVSTPILTEAEVASLDPVDLLNIASAIIGFFQPKAERIQEQAAQAESQ